MRCCLTVGSLLLLAASPLAAQAFPVEDSFWEISPQVGFFVSEEPEETEVEGWALFGARAGYRQWQGFGFELHAAFTPLNLELPGNPPQDVDLPTFLYGVEGVYAWGVAPRADVFVALGFGGITYLPDREDELPGEEDLDAETNPRLSLGGGIHWLLSDAVALRADLRDHIVFDQLSETARALRTVDQGNTNNLEVSLGVAFILP